MVEGGALHVVEGIRAHNPIAMHGVPLSIRSVDPLDAADPKNLGATVRRFEPAWVPGHRCGLYELE
jgi:uncharacterized protein (UPF0276 family)